MRKSINKTIIFTLFVFIPSSAFCLPVAKITGKAIDENGKPIVNGKVYIVFSNPTLGAKQTSAYYATDNEGRFTASDECYEHVGFRVDKEGFYQSRAGYKFVNRSRLLNRWEPWDPTIEVILKKKRNPIPMYDNHRTSYKIPKFDTSIGFDLEKEDWVAPYGGGVFSDFIFNFNVVDRAYTNYECGFTLTFSNPYDGIQEYFFDNNDQSIYKWPFDAPIDGYANKLNKKKSIALPYKSYQSNEKKNVHYIFRVRTKVDENGNIKKARYGKLWGEFGFVPNGKITFRYFLNPDGTRNLEENPDKNLFKKKN